MSELLDKQVNARKESLKGMKIKVETKNDEFIRYVQKPCVMDIKQLVL